MKRGFRGAPRPLLPAMLLVATNPNAGQEHDAVAQSQPSSSTPLVPSTSSPPVQSPPPIPATIPTPTPIPETEPAPFEHTFEEPSPGCLLSQSLFDKGRMIQEEERLRERSSLKLDFQEEVDHRTGNEQVSTVGAKKSTPSPDKGQRAGKAPMITEETPKKSKEQILQEEASLDEAIRLDSLQKEEEAKQIHLDSLLAQRIAEKEELNEQQKKRKAQVQFEAQHYTNEDWDLIREKIEANAELSKLMLGSELQGEDFAKKWLIFSRKEFDKLVKQVESFAPINFEATKASLKRFGEELQTKTPKRLKDDEAKDAEPAKKSGKKERNTIARKGLHTDIDKVTEAMKTPSIATYKIIKQGEKGAYQIVREDGTDVVYINFGAMLKVISRDDLTKLYRIVMNRYGMDGPEDELEKVFWKYLKNMFEEPLSTDPIWSALGQQRIINMQSMLRGGDKNFKEENQMRIATKCDMMEKQLFTMSNQHKDWLVQEQTALGKDFSNPFYG
ncbi:hypothetical protein Tco_0396144 [Tanacetum coccineum]